MRSQWSHRLILLAVLLLGSLISIALDVQQSRSERALIESRFERNTVDPIESLSSEIASLLFEVETVSKFLDLPSLRNRREFSRLVAPVLQRRPGLRAIEWIPRVSNASREFVERAAREDGLLEFEITERGASGMVRAGSRAEYYPVYFIEPLSGNDRALGFDLASNPARLAALVQARDRGEVVATVPIRLVQEIGNQFGFLAFASVYDGGGRPADPAERTFGIEGFALAVVSIETLVDTALQGVARQSYSIQVTDLTGGEPLIVYGE